MPRLHIVTRDDDLHPNATTDVPMVTDMTTNTLTPHIRHYLAGRRTRREIGEATIARHRHCLARFAATFGRRPARNMGAADIERWMATRKHLEASTSRLEYGIVRGFVRWLVRERIVQRDPMVDMKAPTLPRSVPRALNAPDARSLWTVLPDLRARVIVLLMIECGLRRIEVVRLQLGDWDRDAGHLRVVGKGSHERLVPVPPTVRAAMTEYTAGIRSRTGPLIRSQTNPTAGICTEHLSNMMRRWMRDAGIKVAAFDGRGCHSLRHTCASDIAEVEPDLRVVQELLGHMYLTSTQIYLKRLGVERVRAAMEARAAAREAA